MICPVSTPACAGMDLAIFCTAKGPKVAAAKAICATCASINECLRFAIKNDDFEDVIYGGMTGAERKMLVKDGALF